MRAICSNHAINVSVYMNSEKKETGLSSGPLLSNILSVFYLSRKNLFPVVAPVIW